MTRRKLFLIVTQDMLVVIFSNTFLLYIHRIETKRPINTDKILWILRGFFFISAFVKKGL